MEEYTDYQTIDEYIAQYPIEIQEKLNAIRKVIRETAPDAIEKISWRMPTFYLHGNLVHIAAFQKHIGFFPGASGVAAFQEKLNDYRTSKGTIQFPYHKPIPFELISDIVRYRVAENKALFESKIKNKKKK